MEYKRLCRCMVSFVLSLSIYIYNMRLWIVTKSASLIVPPRRDGTYSSFLYTPERVIKIIHLSLYVSSYCPTISASPRPMVMNFSRRGSTMAMAPPGVECTTPRR